MDSKQHHRGACGTCRRRKVRCDFEMPECQRCFTTGRKCLGYERSYSFKITTSKTWPKGGNAKKITHEEAPLCMQLGQTAVVCDAFSGVFMDLLFPKNTDLRQNINSPGSWISSLATLLGSRNETLNQGLLALYTGFVGRKNGDAALINRSAELYSNALHGLRRSDIWVRQKPSPVDIASALASIMVFSRVELLAGEGANGGYMAHIKGGLHLVQRFGANFPCSDLTRILVQRLRYLGFYDAARHRRGYFMCHAPYNTLCLAKKEDPNYLTHKAIEAVITLPTLCEYADRLDATVFETEKKVRRGLLTTQYLLNCASIVENNLDQWLPEMTAVTPCPIVIEASDAEINISPQPHDIGVTAAQASDLWMLHWSLTIRFNLLIRQLHNRFSTLSALVSDPIQLSPVLKNLGKDYSTLDRFADYIRRTLDKGLADNTLQAQGVMAYFFNLHWYWEQRNNIEQKNWCIQSLRNMANNQRLGLDVQVVKNPQKRPSLSAPFLADDFI
ncbi:hypothetical protein H0G86_008847 [Trichoderma simmonsii]|uniref:Zn(2)-C6 fungal-type domain-containing protein n=1 Tax=Trichoderma simmonsii TaxID=1491479 RepID=A0A8G0LJD3_9HYPO|nr:hypothetical protein H0G86_008847 [Trichoderma simmonsii]